MKITDKTDLPTIYASYSPDIDPGAVLTAAVIERIYEDEVLKIREPNSFCGIWQVHTLSSVIQDPIKTLYPGQGSPSKYL